MELVDRIKFKNNINQLDQYDFNTVFNALPDGICIIDQDNYVIFVNDSFKKLPNISNENILYQKVHRSIHNQMLLKAIKFKQEKSLTIVNEKGQRYRIHTNVMTNNSGHYLGMIIRYEKLEINSDNIIRMKIPMTLENPYEEIITKNDQLIRELSKAKKASKSNATIIINGESGTGKELLAKAIHHSSKRKDSNFVAVNCGAIPENLFESHLFGHTKGAFTGAVAEKIGKLEYANGGTIFLDEIGELPLNMQVKLLRVIQERKISKIGSNKVQSIDLRIIAATNKDLSEMVKNGTFREDLYYRLNVIPIHLISLRERNEDIPLLLDYFKDVYCEENGLEKIEFSEKSIEALCSYDWPGNIRELKNQVERMIILSCDDTIEFSDLAPIITNIYYEQSQKRANNFLHSTLEGKLESFDVYEKEIYRKAYEIYGSFNAAGKALGVTHKTVASKLRKYEII
ncbi:MAG TPA: sigma 54-interacting transcriptional regulator [Clostridia bacterium]|nr:sigma 54-interacting transcriptional regulator [Clostridia bacterium]